MTETYEPEGIWFAIPFISVIAANSLLYIFMQTVAKRDNSWVDVMWGLMFCIPNIILWIVRGFDEVTPRMFLITVPVLIWGIRLAVYIAVRHKSEDYRYKEMRLGWEQNGDCGYYWRAYVFIALMQGFFSIVTNSSVLFVNLYSSKDSSTDLMWSDFVGIGIWLLGFLIEVVADAQLTKHLAHPRPGTGKFIRSGLWRYSRHPNYFGESVMWWGLYVIACAEPMGYVTVFSCLFITLAIRFLSGVPFPEKKYANNPEW